VSPEGQAATAALEEGGAPYAWDARGTSLYLGKATGSGSELARIAIDRKSGAPIGPAVTLLSGLPTIRALDVSADGRTLVMSRGGTSNHVWTVALTGPAASQRVEQHQLSSGTRSNYQPAVSPDGRWVAWIEREGTVRSVLLVAFEGGTTKLVGRYTGSTVEYPVWSPDSRRLGFMVTDSSRARVIITDMEGRQPATVAEVVPGVGPPWAWGPGSIVVWSGADSGFAVVDLQTRKRRVIRAPVATLGMYAPILSQDGTTLLAARWQPAGSWNDLHTIRLDGGSWTRVTYEVPGDPGPTLWDATGIYVDVTEALGPRRLPARIWRAAQPGRPFVPFLRPLEHCTASNDAPLSLSRDHARGACTESRATPDLWLVTDFDPEAR
jgi:hypothetical protein